MPLYDVQCLKCNKEFEANSPIADRGNIRCECGGSVKILITNSNNQDWFRPHWNEHLSTEGPVFVKSKRHYRDLCKQHGVTARCLM